MVPLDTLQAIGCAAVCWHFAAAEQAGCVVQVRTVIEISDMAAAMQATLNSCCRATCEALGSSQVSDTGKFSVTSQAIA
jgi:hypothetical protein